MKGYFLIVRPLNLAVLALTMLLFRYCLVDVKSYYFYDFKSYLSNAGFLFLLLSTLFVAAGGYVINDIFDVETDRVNRPKKVIIGNLLSEAQAFNFYKLLCGLSFLFSLLLIWKGGKMNLGSVPILVMVLMYLYASGFKKMAVVGNVVIAICAALPILMITAYDFKINEYDTTVVVMITRGIGISGVFYAGFAFLTTWVREIIKDMQDAEGDREIAAATMPIVWGFTLSKLLATFLQLLILFFLAIVVLYFRELELLKFGLVVLFVLMIPVVLQSIVMWLAKTPQQFKLAGNIGKLHMLFGVFSMLYFYLGSGANFFEQLLNYIVYLFS